MQERQDRHDYPTVNDPSYQGFDSFLACHSLPSNDDLPLEETRLRPPQLHISSVTPKAGA